MRVLAFALVLLVCACTTPVTQTDVTRFHTLGPAPPAASFTIAADPAQAGSLEFQDYASQIADALAQRGWRPVAPGTGPAEVVVRLHWGIGPPETVSWQSPATVGAGWGWGARPYWGGGWYDPFPAWETRTITTFPRWLAVEMTDGAQARAGIRQVVFEGRAVADGTSREIAPVMPALVRALFTGFPGNSGTTVRINVPRQPQ